MKSAKQSAFKMFVGGLPQCAPKKVSVPKFKYFICRFKVCYAAIHLSFLKSRTKNFISVDCNFSVFSAYFHHMFTALFTEIPLRKYFANSITDLVATSTFPSFVTILIIYSQVFILQSSFYLSPFIIPSCFCFPQHSHLDYSYSYKVWCKYACPFISNTVNCNAIKVR